jgi:hypothetical protein
LALTELRENAIRAFGKGEAAALIARLHPAESQPDDPVSVEMMNCECNVEDDWCLPFYYCVLQTCGWNCTCLERGCGTFNALSCNGWCFI